MTLVCPNFFLDGLHSWTKIEDLLSKFLDHDEGHGPTGPRPGPAPAPKNKE